MDVRLVATERQAVGGVEDDASDNPRLDVLDIFLAQLVGMPVGIDEVIREPVKVVLSFADIPSEEFPLLAQALERGVLERLHEHTGLLTGREFLMLLPTPRSREESAQCSPEPQGSGQPRPQAPQSGQQARQQWASHSGGLPSG